MAKPIYIYLDHNHWISLAQANTGHPSGTEYVQLLEDLKLLKHKGAVEFPLSSVHYMELSETVNYKRRTDVARVMGDLSHYKTIAPHHVLQKAEIEQALKKQFGRPAQPTVPKPFGFGAVFSLSGENRVLQLQGSKDVMDNFAKAIGGEEKVKELEVKAIAFSEFELLRGPSDKQKVDLRKKYGYRPEDAWAVCEKRAKQEQELADQLKKNPARRKEVRSIVAARHLYWEMSEALFKIMGEANINTKEFESLGKERTVDLVFDVPTANVIVALLEGHFKAGSRPWTSNDIYDADALCVAVPYCDIVVTEKDACARLKRAGADAHHNTVILNDLRSLLAALGNLL